MSGGGADKVLTQDQCGTGTEAMSTQEPVDVMARSATGDDGTYYDFTFIGANKE